MDERERRHSVEAAVKMIYQPMAEERRVLLTCPSEWNECVLHGRKLGDPQADHAFSKVMLLEDNQAQVEEIERAYNMVMDLLEA